MLFAEYFYFRFIGSLIIGFAMGETESRDADIAVNFFE